MENERSILYKYPRTYHFWYSPGTSSDDRIISEPEIIDTFKGLEVVVTEKLDGENTTLYRDYMHVRSLDSRPHPSQNWVRSLHASIQHEIPDGWRICGENMYAQHSIRYDKLKSFFYVFSIWNEKNVALSWDDTVAYSQMLGLETVPVLYRGLWDIDKIKACWTGKSTCGGEQEGYVVRTVDEMPFPTVGSSKHEMPVFEKLVKYVRAKHVKTDDHWRTTWVPNSLEK